MDGGARKPRGGYAGRNMEVPTEVAESCPRQMRLLLQDSKRHRCRAAIMPTANCANAESLPELLGKADKNALGAAYETKPVHVLVLGDLAY